VLTAIRGSSAELSIGGVIVTHPVESITDAWFGQYLLLWRPASGQPVSLGLNSRGADVRWLRESLASIDPAFATADLSSDVYDENLYQAVQAFQRVHRLGIDGVAGQQTQIIINSLLAVDGTPRLRTPLLAQD